MTKIVDLDIYPTNRRMTYVQQSVFTPTWRELDHDDDVTMNNNEIGDDEESDGSDDEDDSDEAYAARHQIYEALESKWLDDVDFNCGGNPYEV